MKTTKEQRLRNRKKRKKKQKQNSRPDQFFSLLGIDQTFYPQTIIIKKSENSNRNNIDSDTNEIFIKEKIKEGVPCYKKNEEKIVELTITIHARNRFIERWRKLYNKPLPQSIDSFIAENFSKSKKVKGFSSHENKRLKRYGKDTLFFRNNDFTFVVQDARIKTIEISRGGLRHLNKDKSRNDFFLV
ncbi:MAG: hypothetical protein JXR63_12165 [Spirochaetales bacterium]|nr:hypothetical protein [Spirochaetales bacterium]